MLPYIRAVAEVGWSLGYLTSKQLACVSQGQICGGNRTDSHCEMEVADLLLLLLRSPAISLGSTILGEIFAYVTVL